MSPFFTIIIPVYNVAPYLRECLDSVLAQTFTDWEAICVDDGSTDGSGAILDEYAAKDNRFKVIHQQNAGVSAARNVALDIAKGRWIIFVDGDDKIAIGGFDLIAKCVCTSEDIDIVKFGFFTKNSLDASDIISQVPDNCRKMALCSGKVSDVNSILSSFAWDIWGWNSVFRRRCIGSIRFPSIRISEDRCFAIQVLCNARSVVSTDGKYYIYVQHPDSAVGIASVSHIEDAFVAGDVIRETLFNSKYYGLHETIIKRGVMNFYIGQFLWLYGGCPRGKVRIGSRALFIDKVDELLAFGFFTYWQRVVINLFLKHKSWVGIYCCLLLPYELKRRRLCSRLFKKCVGYCLAVIKRGHNGLLQ